MALNKRRKDERKSAALDLHGAGWSGCAISRVLNMSEGTITRWLRELDLQPNSTKFAPKFEPVEAAQMYLDGASDGEIARRFGATQSGACRWRQRRGLEANFEGLQPLAPHIKRSARNMLADGASRRQVAVALDIGCLQTVQRLRRDMDKRGLRPTGLTNKAIRAQVLKDKTVLPRISRAVGANLPPDVKHDATSSLYLAVLEGLIRRDLIERRAPRFRSKAFALNGNDFSRRSLDDDSGGWSMLDRLDDPDALAQFDRISFR